MSLRAGTASRARPASPTQLDRLVGEVGDELDAAATQPNRPRRLVDLHVDRPRQLAVQGDQLAVEGPQLLVRLRAVELRALERGGILGIRHVLPGEGGETRELAPAPLARRLRDRRVDMVGEELERPPLAVLLAH